MGDGEGVFWRMRSQLWPPKVGPGGDPYQGSMLASELGRMKSKSLVGTELSTWASTPAVEGFQGIVGGQFNIEREVLGFWIPFAYAYADREYRLQQDRSTLTRTSLNPLAPLLKEAEKLAGKFRGLGGLFHHATIWKDTPFLPLNKDWQTLRAAGDSFAEEVDRLKANCEDLRKTISQQAAKPHGNSKFWDRTMAAMLGLSWMRLVGTEPTAAELIDLTLAVIAFIDPTRTIFDPVITSVHAAQKGQWAVWTDLRAFLNLTENFWMEQIVMKVADDDLRGGLVSALVNFMYSRDDSLPSCIFIDWISQ